MQDKRPLVQLEVREGPRPDQDLSFSQYRSNTTETFQRLTLVGVGLKHRVDLCQAKKIVHFGAGIEQLQRGPIPNRVGITGHQLPETRTIDFRDSSEINEHLGVFLLKGPLEFLEFEGLPSQLRWSSKLEHQHVFDQSTFHFALAESCHQRLARPQLFEALIAGEVMPLELLYRFGIQTFQQVVPDQFFAKHWILMKHHLFHLTHVSPYSP